MSSAFNLVTSVTVDAAGKLTVNGTTTTHDGKSKTDLGSGAEILLAVIAVDDQTKRCEPTVLPADATVSPWRGTSPPGSHDFKGHDHVYAVGFAKSDDFDPFVWGDELCINKPEAPE
jgi:hypothetical protein